jgi:hypothetical protein
MEPKYRWALALLALSMLELSISAAIFLAGQSDPAAVLAVTAGCLAALAFGVVL